MDAQGRMNGAVPALELLHPKPWSCKKEGAVVGHCRRKTQENRSENLKCTVKERPFKNQEKRKTIENDFDLEY